MFVKQFSDSNNANHLNFEDEKWYAVATGNFRYKGNPVKIPMIFSVKAVPGASANWMIASLGKSTVLQAESSLQPLNAAPPEEQILASSTIPSYSHATNFVSLVNVLSKTVQPSACFTPQALKDLKSAKMVQLLQSGDLEFISTQDITYQFYQLPGWYFTVEYFDRESNNGWLINKLTTATEAEKAIAQQQLLDRKD